MKNKILSILQEQLHSKLYEEKNFLPERFKSDVKIFIYEKDEAINENTGILYVEEFEKNYVR